MPAPQANWSAVCVNAITRGDARSAEVAAFVAIHKAVESDPKMRFAAALEEASEAIRSCEEGYEAGYEYDYGEFSGPATGRAERKAVKEIAARRSVDFDELYVEAMCGPSDAGWDEEDAL